ncbi:integrase [Salinibacter ruber]|uniref:tyrosine-type recombinase/integrase n=1 Tax=Salinibacter ruber TaxID=146919 RepID=UPI002169FAE8|nr:site-specific integrase [Salinibacter ruber]MCS3750588.1 integrase [Salinibacter ruber]
MTDADGTTDNQRIGWKEATGRYINQPENTFNTSRLALRTFFQDAVSWDVHGPAGVPARTISEYVHRDSISQTYSLDLYSRLDNFYSWLIEQGHLEEGKNPMDEVNRPETPAGEKRYLTPTEFTTLTRTIRSDYEERSGKSGRHGIKDNEIIWVLPPLQFGAATGLRPTAMKKLRVGDVDLEEKTLQVPALEQGTGIDREIPLCQMAVNAVREAVEEQIDTDFLFNGARSATFNTRALSRTVKRYIREAGVRPDLNFTDCTRHTCASWLTKLGYPTRDVAQMLGHSTLRSTEPYRHLAPSLRELRSGGSAHFENFAEETSELGFFPPVFAGR